MRTLDIESREFVVGIPGGGTSGCFGVVVLLRFAVRDGRYTYTRTYSIDVLSIWVYVELYMCMHVYICVCVNTYMPPTRKRLPESHL